MKQEFGIKTKLTTLTIYIIANFIFLAYGRVVVILQKSSIAVVTTCYLRFDGFLVSEEKQNQPQGSC